MRTALGSAIPQIDSVTEVDIMVRPAPEMKMIQPPADIYEILVVHPIPTSPLRHSGDFLNLDNRRLEHFPIPCQAFRHQFSRSV